MVIDMATSAFAWPSILVVLDRTIKKCDRALNLYLRVLAVTLTVKLSPRF